MINQYFTDWTQKYWKLKHLKNELLIRHYHRATIARLAFFLLTLVTAKKYIRIKLLVLRLITGFYTCKYIAEPLVIRRQPRPAGRRCWNKSGAFRAANDVNKPVLTFICFGSPRIISSSQLSLYNICVKQ